MATERRKPFDLKKDCHYLADLKLVSLRCRICKNKCEIGEEVIRAVDQVELDEYHRKNETE